MQLFSKKQSQKVQNMEFSLNFIPEDVLRFYGRLGMELNKLTPDLQNTPNTVGHALEIANDALLDNFLESKPRVVADTALPTTSIISNRYTNNNSTIAPDSNSRNVHIPYILNDRVYRGSVRSTGNFHMHIKRRHPDLMGKIYDMKVNALVERRDRFLRNRKTTRRRGVHANGNRKSRSGQRLTCSTQPTSELFKIKAAFQRHQLQKQQNRHQQENHKRKQKKTEQNSGILNKWNLIDHFLVTPGLQRAQDITLMEVFNEQPLDFSLKQYNAAESTVININYTERADEHITNEHHTNANLGTNEVPLTMVGANEQVTDYQLISTYNNNNNQVLNYITTNQQSSDEILANNFTQQHEEHVPPLFANNSEQSVLGRATTISAITPCPSDLSSYEPNQGLNSRSYDLNYNHMGFIKNELLLNEVVQPIDLSAQPTSSDLSASSGFSSAVDIQTSCGTTSFNTTGEMNLSTRCEDVISQLAITLQNLQRELQTHNQTNNNWLCLEIAKFKFLHPNFEFQY
ncbi:uncharacterized protein LOC110117736 isoform X2 [Ceratitis capitata]|uniref:uncharacterized protein LOC110117736 isoform X2 n=1 Tax=Ceratitis capitata TaxID=7213 RepID=UPI000A0F591B|nr:uncharacterized protein LOC110117736 isoform X2 [Ceratitis capitata]